MASSHALTVDNPIARVLPLLDVPHLDRSFDYRVPAELDSAAQAGTRVRVTFAGRQVDAYILERRADTDFQGTILPVRRVVSAHPVMCGDYLELLQWTARRYTGTLPDVIRLAVPPRIAQVEKEELSITSPLPGPADQPVDELLSVESLAAWDRYRYGSSLVRALPKRSVRAAWQLLTDDNVAERVCDMVRIARHHNGSVLVVVPDQFDLRPLLTAVTTELGREGIAALSADSGPTRRYRAWIQAFYGVNDVIIGTRAAAFTPMRNLHTILILDDGNDVYADPHAPYPHIRDVLAYRAESSSANFIAAGWACSVAMHDRVTQGWAHYLLPEKTEMKGALPRISAPGDSDRALEIDPLARAARIPHAAFRAASAAVERGEPVLFQVPRTGYIPSIVCAHCGESSRCAHCGGPLYLDGSHSGDSAGHFGEATPRCRWCGTLATQYSCQQCGSTRLRATVVGARRTAEELGRAFPGIPLVLSYGDKRVETIKNRACIVVATPGSEPLPQRGYGAIVLLDSWALLQRPDLRAEEDTMRLWCNTVRLALPSSQGGEVIVVADPQHFIVQGLIQWNPQGVAERIYEQRQEVKLPPARHFIAIDGDFRSVRGCVEEVLAECGNTPVEALGPVDLPSFERIPASVEEGDDVVRMMLRVSGDHLDTVLAVLRQVIRQRSAHISSRAVRIQVDPVHMG